MERDGARAELLARLALHVPSDGDERTHLDATRRLVESEPACFARDAFAPGHLTASAFIVDRGGRLLLHRHRRLDRWLQMGGHFDDDRDPAIAARREGREESGLDDLEPVLAGGAILDVDVHAIPSGRREPAHLHHDVRYLLMTRSPERIAMADLESTDLAFFSLEDARARLGDVSAARVIEKIRRALATTS